MQLRRQPFRSGGETQLPLAHRWRFRRHEQALLLAAAAPSPIAAPIGAGLSSPPSCAQFTEFFQQIEWDFSHLASHGPISPANVSELLALVRRRSGWSYYFVEVAIVNSTLYYRGSGQSLGPWQRATMKLLSQAVNKHGRWIPDVHFVLSVLDDPFLERGRQTPLPLLSSVRTFAHWDIPVPAQVLLEEGGGISSAGVRNDMVHWSTQAFQHFLEERYPWESRSERAFFRGHDWESINNLLEVDANASGVFSDEPCIFPGARGFSFSFRRWYEKLSSEGGALEHLLDVGLTGAPEYTLQQYPRSSFAKPVSIPEHAQHKYLLQLDGTVHSYRFLKLLMLGSVVLKQGSPYEEYFYRNLQPYKHYVPFSRDRCSYTNLSQTILWLRQNDAEARAIAKAGQAYAMRMLSMDGATCYWQRVLTLYGALQAYDPRLAIRISDLTPWRG